MARTGIRRGVPPFLRIIKSGAHGQAQGGPADASAGLQTVTDASGGSWAYNPLASEWQFRHLVQWGDSLWALSATYYGQSTLDGVHEIYGVPQNQPILGADMKQAIAGDVLLIPALQQPAGAIPPGGGGSAQPLPIPSFPVPAPEPQPTTPPASPSPIGAQIPALPGLPATPPAGWPSWIPWPPYVGGAAPSPEPGTAQPPPVAQAPGTPTYQPLPVPSGGTVPTYPGGATPILTGATPEAPIEQAPTTAPASWWTPGRTAGVAIGGTVVAGLVIWGIVAAAKPKRRRRRHG